MLMNLVKPTGIGAFVVFLVTYLADLWVPKPPPSSEQFLTTGGELLQRLSSVPMVINKRQVVSALYDARRQRLYVSPSHFAGRDLDTLWRAAHEARHTYQTNRLWRSVYAGKWTAEFLGVLGILGLLANHWTHIPIAVASFALFVGSAGVWAVSHILLEIDACLWAPVLLHEALGQQGIDATIMTSILRNSVIRTRYHAIRYTFYGVCAATAYITVASVLLVFF